VDNKLTRRKVILYLLDCAPKTAEEVAVQTDEPLETVFLQVEELVSENTCEKEDKNGVEQYTVKKDVYTLAQLVKEFLESGEENEKSNFITSQYYFDGVNSQLVDYILERFHLDSIVQTDEDREALERILLVSPSALHFALHGDKTLSDQLWSDLNQLNLSNSDRARFMEIHYSQFLTNLLERLISDTRNPAYGFLYAKLQLRAARITIQVSLATLQGKYVEKGGGGLFSLAKAVGNLRAGQIVYPVNFMSFSDDGIAFMHLGEFQAALNSFDQALVGIPASIPKAILLNNKGLAFLRFKQYQKAIECFEEGIKLDPSSQIPQLRMNKQLAQDYLAYATDTDKLTQPTQIRFVRYQPVPFEETRFYEFKEVGGVNPVSSIGNTSDEYAVAFLNSKGGRIFWGIRDSDRIIVGLILDEKKRNEIRRKVSEKLGAIRPPISVTRWQLEFHEIHDLQGAAIPDLWIVELVISPPQEKENEIFYTGSGELFVKTPGGKKKLLGPEVTEFIRHRLSLQSITEQLRDEE
jgi:tetratricopeptide (TPR) repeat protein